MLTRVLSYRRLVLMTLSLTYITLGMLGTLPEASLIVRNLRRKLTTMMGDTSGEECLRGNLIR